MSRGFTFIELLVTLVIFSLVVIGIYFFFDQGQWLYLETERRTRSQETARTALEQMERDFRMIGAGVPRGVDDANQSWLPAIFSASVCSIGFTGDIDNGTRLLTFDVGTEDNNHIYIGQDNYYDEDGDGNIDSQVPVVLETNGRDWEDLIAGTLFSQGVITTAAVPTPSKFKAIDSSVHTLERVFYRMVDQAGNLVTDGICQDPYPYCILQRQEFRTNNPDETDPESESEGAVWETMATNVSLLQLLYFNNQATELDTDDDIPPDPANFSSIDKIKVTLMIRDRNRQAGTHHDSALKSVVLIRNRKL
jgi:prepilin-type N-terminal cleavage/methylation domain-containing protein